LSLPNSKNNEKTNKQFISLSVTEGKKYFIDKEEVSVNNLETSLMSKIDKTKELTVVLRLAQNLTIQNLVDIQQIGAKNKLKFVLATNAK
jgi:biopolymer transport protein ExbD